MSDLHTVRIDAGENRLFTRVFIDDEELRGVTRVWFDSGRMEDSGPKLRYLDRTTVHVEFVRERLWLDASSAMVDAHERSPMKGEK